MPTNTFDPTGALIGGGLSYALAPRGLNLGEIGNAGRLGLSGIEGILSGQRSPQLSEDILSSYNNPYLDRSIQASKSQLFNDFNESVLPQISDAFSQAGSFGSGRQAALTGKASSALTNKLADLDAQQRSNAYNAAYNAAYNSGQNQFSTQANAANTLFNRAAMIAQDEPWRQGLSGAITGGANNNIGNLVQGAKDIGQGLYEIGGKIYDAVGNLFNQETGQWVDQDGLNVWSGDQPGYLDQAGEWLGDVGTGIADAASGAWEGVTDFFGW